VVVTPNSNINSISKQQRFNISAYYGISGMSEIGSVNWLVSYGNDVGDIVSVSCCSFEVLFDVLVLVAGGSRGVFSGER